MTLLLSIDPGKNTGVSLGFYDAITPYLLMGRCQIHGGLEGFATWWESESPEFDEIVVEKFILDPNNQFTADLTPKEIEGLLRGLLGRERYESIAWQPRTDKALLTGYPASAKTKAQKQRARFDFLARFGLHAKGADNDDSNDAITHALVYLKRRKHMPTLLAFWPPKPGLTA